MAVDLTKLAMPSDRSAIGLGQLAKQLPTNAASGAIPRSQLQQAAAQITQQEGDIGLEQKKKALQDQEVANQTELTKQRLDLQKSQANRELALQSKQREVEQTLNNIDKTLYKQIYSDVLQFKKDEIGKIEWNQRQLSDWAIANAKSQEDLAQKQQDIQQGAERASQIYNKAIQLLQQKYEQDYIAYERAAKQASAIELNAMDAKAALLIAEKRHQGTMNLQNKINQLRQEAQNLQDRNNMITAAFSGAGTIAGGIIGGVIGGPLGAGLGMSIGGTLGTTASTLARS